jgi:NADH-quinone oxidoreductase subunit B
VTTSAGALQPTRHVLEAGRRFSLWVFDVGLACCAVEVLAAALGGDDDVARLGAVPLVLDPAEAQVLVVSGTVTERLAPSVRALHDRLPDPKHVLSFGACANSGGPYWDSYAVVKGVHTLLPVDVWVPGCPPRPEALLDGLLQLDRQLRGEPEPPGAAPTELLRRAGG